jgi:hypothetical protein
MRGKRHCMAALCSRTLGLRPAHFLSRAISGLAGNENYRAHLCGQVSPEVEPSAVSALASSQRPGEQRPAGHSSDLQDVIVSTFADEYALSKFTKYVVFGRRDGSRTPENHALQELAGTPLESVRCDRGHPTSNSWIGLHHLPRRRYVSSTSPQGVHGCLSGLSRCLRSSFNTLCESGKPGVFLLDFSHRKVGKMGSEAPLLPRAC